MSGGEAFAVDDEARFRAAFHQHYGAILAYSLRRTFSREDAEEVAATTFATAWRRVHDLPPEPFALTWLYRVAWKTLANQRRSANRRSNLVGRLSGLRGTPGNDGGEAPEVEVDERLAEALGHLRPKDQEVLRLIAWEELTNDEAAAVLDCTPNAFAIRLHRARKALRAELTRRGFGADLPPPEGSDE